MMKLVGRAPRAAIACFATAGMAAATLFAGVATAPADTFEVGTSGNNWNPDLVEAQPGDTVNWTFTSLHNLNLLDPEGGAILTDEPPSGTTSHLFDVAGDYVYYCSIHGGPTFGMRGEVQVDVTQPPAPELALSVAPKRATGKVGKVAKFTATLSNSGDAAATDASVCVTAKKRLVKVKGERCATVESLEADGEMEPKFKLVPTRKARGKKVEVTFTATAMDVNPEMETATLKVKR
jgi:plastocyanin